MKDEIQHDSRRAEHNVTGHRDVPTAEFCAERAQTVVQKTQHNPAHCHDREREKLSRAFVKIHFKILFKRFSFLFW